MKLYRYMVVLCCLALPLSAQTTSEPGVISVTGAGEVAGAPDIATLSLGVSQTAKTAADALALTSEATRAVLDQLRFAGIADADIQTSELSLNPQWNHDNSRGQEVNEITGFVARNLVTVTLRDLDQMGEVLDYSVTSGANNFRGLSFGFAQPGPLRDEARILAVRDARRKAEMMVEAAGVELGRIVSMTEAGSQRPPIMRQAARMEASSDVPIAQGEVSISAQVSIVFELAQ